MIRTDVGFWASTSSYGTAAFLTGSFTPPANSLLVIIIYRMGNATSGDLGAITISGGGLSPYTPQINVFDGNFWSVRLDVITVGVGGSPASMQISVDDANNIAGWCVGVVAFTEYSTPTLAGGVTSGSNTNIGDGAETQTLSTAPTVDDVSMFAIGADAPGIPSNPTLTAGWADSFDSGVSGGGFGNLMCAHRENSTSTTVSVTDTYTATGTLGKAEMASWIVRGNPSAAGFAGLITHI